MCENLPSGTSGTYKNKLMSDVVFFLQTRCNFIEKKKTSHILIQISSVFIFIFKNFLLLKQKKNFKLHFCMIQTDSSEKGFYFNDTESSWKLKAWMLAYVLLRDNTITQTCPCNILRFFIVVNDEKMWHFSYFCLKHRLWIHVRTASLAEAVLTSTHNLCFRVKITKKNVYPCKPQFSDIKVGCKGVFITRICFHDAEPENLDKSNDIGRLPYHTPILGFYPGADKRVL